MIGRAASKYLDEGVALRERRGKQERGMGRARKERVKGAGRQTLPEVGREVDHKAKWMDTKKDQMGKREKKGRDGGNKQRSIMGLKCA